jgi:hypothetical protein
MNRCPRSLRRAGALKTLLIVLGVLFGGIILVCAGCLTLAYFKTKPLAAELFRMMATAPLESTQLPQAQKDRIQACVDRVMKGVTANKISLVQLGTIMQGLETGPYGDLTIIELTRGRIAGLLQQDEKRWKDASLTIDRFARGVEEGRIPRDRVDRVLGSVSGKDESGGREAKEALTEVEAEEFLELALKEADRVEIPSEPHQADLAGELERVVNRVMGGGTPSSSPADSDGPEAPAKRSSTRASERPSRR